MIIESDVIQQFKDDKSGFQYLPNLLVDGVLTGISDVRPVDTQKEALAIATIHAEKLRKGLANGSIKDNRKRK